MYQCLYRGMPAIIVSRNALPIGEFRMIILPQLIPLQSAGMRICVSLVAYFLTMSSIFVFMFVIMTSQSLLKIHSALGYFSIASLIKNILPHPIGLWVSGIGGNFAIILEPLTLSPPSFA